MIELSREIRQSIDNEFAKQDDDNWFMTFSNTPIEKDDDDDCNEED